MEGIRYVRPCQDGRWDILKEGHRRALHDAPTQEAAVELARRLVRDEGGGAVLIMNRSGKIAKEITVWPAKSRAAAWSQSGGTS